METEKRTPLLRLKDIMEQRRLTNKELADALGVTPQYISSVVNGHQYISLEVLNKFAEYLQLPPAALLQGYQEKVELQAVSKGICPYCGRTFQILREDEKI